MRIAKMVIGIISIVLSLVVILQSCVAGLGNALEDNGEVSGSAGAILAVCLLIAGIVGVAAKSHPGAGYVSGAFYAFGGLIGICNYGSYSDLAVWSVICFIFAAVFIIGSPFQKKTMKKSQAPKEKEE